ncbi:Transcription factor -like protein [Cladobotryum mycophilum]|uniref:Transcription factor -like protein n=1 Tax=Cladobotryum mycophilum TaxID=491253 RepID=A0ABR0SAW9_9HYPO
MVSAPPPPQDSVPVGGIPAGYGRSCTNCSRAKCRCILRPEGGKCDRCHRLGKDCQQMVTSRKRVAKRTTASRTAQLEEKLDDLVSILRATQQPPPTTTTTSNSGGVNVNGQPTNKSISAYQQPPPGYQFLSRLDSLADAATTSSCGSTPGTQQQHAHAHVHPHPHPHPHPRANILGHGNARPSSLSENDRLPEPTPVEAEAYLNKFRQWLEFWPFMRLDPDISSDMLRRERPFLWLSIMNITTTSLPQQYLLRERLRQEISQRLIVNSERSMDLLLGLLTHISWATLNSGNGGKPFLTLFIQMAASIIYEMGLTKFPNEEHYSAICFKVWGGRFQYPSKDRTMEERRAVLSVWFMSSVYASFMGRMEALVFTPHMQDCLEVLEREKEHPNDEILVTLVKLQLIGEEARKLLTRDMMTREMIKDGAQVPAYVFKKGLLDQLQALRQALRPCIGGKHVIYAHATSTEAQILAIGLFGEQKLPDAPRIESMYAAVVAVKNWYEAFFSVPIPSFPGLPFNNYVGLAQMHSLLYNLTVAEDPLWDKDIVRSTADLLLYLDQTTDVFFKVDAVYGFKYEGEDSSIFAKCARMLRNIRSVWEPALSQHLGGGLPTPNSQSMSSSVAAESAMMVEQQQHQHASMMEAADQHQHHQHHQQQGAQADFNDLTWMTDVFGPWEF